MSTRTEFAPVRLIGPLCARSDTAASRTSRMRAARRTETPVAGWLRECTLDNSQLPTANFQPLPNPNSQAPLSWRLVSYWKLGVGSGWELAVGSWKLLRNNSEGSHLPHLSLRHFDGVVSWAKRRQAEIDDHPRKTRIRAGADLDRHGDRLAVAIDHACRG